MATLSQAYSEQAAQLSVPFIDLFTPLVSDTHYMREVAESDGAHPGGSGYEKISTLIGATEVWWFHRPQQTFNLESSSASLTASLLR